MKSRCIVNLQIRIEHRKAGGARREWPVQDAMSRTDKDYEPQNAGAGSANSKEGDAWPASCCSRALEDVDDSFW